MLKTLALLLVSILSLAHGQKVDDEFTHKHAEWGNWKGENAVASFCHDPETGHKAPGALSIKIGPKHPENLSACFTRHINVEAGKTYTGLVYVKAKEISETAQISLAFQGQNAEKKFLGTEVQSTHLRGLEFAGESWKRLVYTIIVPQTGKWAEVGCLLCTLGISRTSEGQVWYDDFLFFENTN